MLNKIKNRIDLELDKFISRLDKAYSLNKLSPLLFNNIKNFLLRDGKRARPILFVIGFMGFAKKIPRGLYTSALSLELLHDFMLVHDDIIDKSDTRRGKPSMHVLLNQSLKKFKKTKFSGQDLAIVVGDVMYALSINAFLAIDVNFARKEKALKRFVDAAIYTGSGEFIEILYGAEKIDKINKNNIYRIYDYKTAFYTFACPLSIGAILAGANNSEIDKLFEIGMYLGRAFQIKDDILGMFAEEKETGKSTTSDLQEGKRTILIWKAYNKCKYEDRLKIKEMFSQKKITKKDLTIMRDIITKSGALSYAENEIKTLTHKVQKLILSSKLNQNYKKTLLYYSNKILS